MCNVIAASALSVFVAVAGGARWAAALPPITVPAGAVVSIPTPGVIRADTNPADVAGASAGPGEVTIRGIRPGTATLLITMPDSIEARLVRVVAADPRQGIAAAAVRGCLDSGNLAAGNPSEITFDGPDLDATWAPGGWDALWAPPGATIWASSALMTPLYELGIPAAPGVQADWLNRWEVIATDDVRLVGYRVPFGAGTLMLADSTLGPAGVLEASAGDMKFSTVALMPQTGQVLQSAQTSLSLGTFDVGYETGPSGGSPTVGLHTGSVTVSAATPPGRGVQVGLGLSLAHGLTVAGSWMPEGGWNAEVAVPLGSGAVAQAAVTPSQGSVSYTPPAQAAAQALACGSQQVRLAFPAQGGPGSTDLAPSTAGAGPAPATR